MNETILTKEGKRKIEEELEYILEERLPYLNSIPVNERDSEVIEQLDYYPKRMAYLKAMLTGARIMRRGKG